MTEFAEVICGCYSSCSKEMQGTNILSNYHQAKSICLNRSFSVGVEISEY